MGPLGLTGGKGGDTGVWPCYGAEEEWWVQWVLPGGCWWVEVEVTWSTMSWEVRMRREGGKRWGEGKRDNPEARRTHYLQRDFVMALGLRRPQ